jgi:hypothetical protein
LAESAGSGGGRLRKSVKTQYTIAAWRFGIESGQLFHDMTSDHLRVARLEVDAAGQRNAPKAAHVEGRKIGVELRFPPRPEW